MKSIFLVSAVAHAEYSEEATMLQIQVRSKGTAKVGAASSATVMKSLEDVASTLTMDVDSWSLTKDEVQDALANAAEALSTLSPAIRQQVENAQQQINHATAAVQACHDDGGIQLRARLEAHMNQRSAELEQCQSDMAAAQAEADEACNRAEDCLCDEARERLSGQEQLCGAKTETYEEAWCEHNLQCVSFVECHESEISVYNALREDVEGEMAVLEQEYIAAQQSECITALIIGAMTPPFTPIDFDELQGCSSVDTYVLDIIYPAMPAAPPACPVSDIECGAAPEEFNTRLQAYWESGNCGVHGNDWNWGWCGNQAGNCPQTVSTDICESGSAELALFRGTGAQNSYQREGCNYFWWAQYRCIAGLPAGIVGSFNGWAATAGVYMLEGDFNGDGNADVALIGGPGWGSIPVAHSRGDGRWSVTNCGVESMNSWIDAPGARPLVGDFDGDGRDDVALTGGHGWGSIPVAFSEGAGCWRVTNHAVSNFPSWASHHNVQSVVGDFDGDGKADIAAIGNPGWGSLPTSFSNGDGTFRVTNHGLGGSFNSWAATAGVYVLAGDQNGDGKDDVMLIGGSGWGTLPVALSDGSGRYNEITNCGCAHMNGWIRAAGNTRPLVGDFNGDGRADVALTGGNGWGTIPIAFAEGNQCWRVTNNVVSSFPSWTASANVKAVATDVNGDGKTDIAAIGNGGWSTLPVAFANGDGTFRVVNQRI